MDLDNIVLLKSWELKVVEMSVESKPLIAEELLKRRSNDSSETTD